MKDKLIIFAIALAGGLAGANVQPVLTGAGKLLFPENSTPATISASSGSLAINAGGTNQNISLTPTGTGWIQTAFSLISTGVSGAFPTAPFIRTSYNGTAGEILAYDGNASTFKPLELRGSPVYIGDSHNFGCGGQTSPNYAVDCTGDVNASGVYRKGGTAGVGSGSTITVCTAGACTSSCTLIFNGGIRTGGTCP